MSAQNISVTSDRRGNAMLQCPDTMTEMLQIPSKQATDLVAISPQQTTPQQVCFPRISSNSSTSPLGRTCAPASVKPSNIGNVVLILSSLLGVVAGDEFWMKAASYLMTSKPAREFVACEAICLKLRIKWLRNQVQNFKM